MKALLLSLAVLAGSMSVLAQTEPGDKAERARIGAERAQAEARFSAQEAACYKHFGVNDCLKAARTERRELLSGLRRQELSLNEAERKRKSAGRLRAPDEVETQTRQEQAATRRDAALARQAQKEAQAVARAATAAKAPKDPKTAKAAKTPVPSASRAAKAPSSHDTAKALQQSQQRQQEAKERRERVAKRQTEAAKSGVKPLPAPP